MFCPQCGQQQASDAARFCSRCGFQLEAVSGLLVTGGAAPELAVEAVPIPETPRRKGARLGGKLMLSGMFLAPVLAMLSELIGTPDELALLGVIVFMAGLFRLLYALIFEDGPYRRQLQQQQVYVPPAQFAPREASALPPSQGVPARAYAAPPRAETGEIAYRPSVTEGTTRLLDDERDRERGR
ncbi:MAG: hypothetical protein QOJ70_2863 [Acidobacteriota bacterium]|jgi:hypothetical protein|nr:hypothetical protein [Acidobacteriota bacterium]MDT7809050.1 hypothetical protein [Acidobacteriota bacterium]